MAYTDFEITLSATLSPAQIAAAFTELIPAGLQVDVQTEFPDELGAVWARIHPTPDPDWPCFVSVTCADSCGIAPYEDLVLARHLWERFGVSALCHTYPFLEEVDPRDPYWSLACVSGAWHLADTSGTLLSGTGTDKVRLVRPVEVPW
ncbi:hypothetical protein ACQ86G_19260 [Roseateles chitinivorans]|uniref:hypothetical protein n=1 Tax=Roseateles chitinivorans TaxID=2917965 RepID=UPI003D67CDD8